MCAGRVDTEVSRRVWKGSSPGSWKLTRGQVTSGRKNLELDETGANEKCSIITRGSIMWHLAVLAGSIDRL